MNQFVSATLIASIGFVIIQFASADLKEIECKGVKYQVNEAHQAEIKQCLTKVGVDTFKKLNAENAGCFSRCTMMQKGLIDDSGKPHKEKIMGMIDEHVPDPLKGEWKSALEICLDTEGGKINVADEKTCASFLPLTMCCHEAYLKICMS